MNLAINQPVAFKWEGRFRDGAKVKAIYPEFKGVAVRVEWRDMDYLVAADEIRTQQDFEEEREREAKRKNLEQYGDLEKAWRAGKRTNKELAEATNTPIYGIASRIRAARRRGLLT